jgi:hypothetical protein
VSYTTDLVDGTAALLADAGLGVYRPAGPAYTTTETGIVIGSMPDAPDRVICLTPYPVEDTGMAEATTGMQIRMRAGVDPRQVLAMADGVFDLLDNRSHFRFGAVLVDLAWRQSEAQLGADAQGRLEIASNYYLRTVRSTPYAYE